MDFSQAKLEATKAKKCISRMKSAKSFEDYDEAWEDFLSRIENIFKKVQSACSAESAKFNGACSTFKHQKKTDPLLIYLTQARNAFHHGLGKLSEQIPESINYLPTINGASFTYQKDKFGNTKVSSNSPLLVFRIPSEIIALPCKNRGVTFDPPQIHLGKKLVSKSPIEIAELGLVYYENFILKIEEIFSIK